jgi:hypothetical protein
MVKENKKTKVSKKTTKVSKKTTKVSKKTIQTENKLMENAKKIKNFIVQTSKSIKLCNMRDSAMFNLKNVDTVLLKKILDSNLINYSDMKALMCLFDMILHENKTTSDNLPKLDHKIYKYLKNAQQIATKSVFGYVFYVDMISDNNRIIAKRSQIDDIEVIQKEYITGVKSINPLRALTPCFALTLGCFSCNKVKDIPSEKGMLCSSNTKNPETLYLIMENVNGKTMSECLQEKSMDARRFMGIFLHILISLEIAQRQCCFTHFDLHTDNVLIKKITSKIRYSMTDLTVDYSMSASEEIPVIIDYGLSFSIVDGFPLGEYRGLGGNPGNYMVSCFDMYRFLVSCVYFSNKVKNNHLTEFLLSLFDFFQYDVYLVYDKYLEEKAKPEHLRDYYNAISEPSKDFCNKVLVSSPYITPLQFLDQIYTDYPDLTEQHMEVVHSSLSLNIDISAKIYCDLFKCGSTNEIYDTLNKCVKNQPSYILNMYNIYLLKQYNDKVKDAKIATFLEEQTNIFRNEISKTQKYDEIVFSQKIDFDMKKIDMATKSSLDILNIKLTRNKKYIKKNFDKIYPENFQTVKEAHDQIVRLEKYLDVYHMIREISHDHGSIYDNFLKDMDDLITEIDTLKIYRLRVVMIAYRYCLSIQQYYDL